MKKFTNKKSGFTLIEIIVVLIIVGILAAIALPNLFANIGKSKGAQALASMSYYKTALESCILGQNTAAAVAPCTIAGQGLNATATISGTQFDFSIAAATAARGATTGATILPANSTATTATYSLIATEHTSGETITLSRAADGTYTCSTGTASIYTGIC